MLVLKHGMAHFINTLRGSYRLKGPRLARVRTQDGKLTDTPLSFGQSSTLLEGMTLEAERELCILTLNSGVTVSVWTNFGWRTLIEGKHVRSGSSVSVDVKYGSLLRIRAGAATPTYIELIDERIEPFSFVRIKNDIRSSLAPVLGSIGVHILLILLCILMYNIDFSFLNFLNDEPAPMAEIEITQEEKQILMASGGAGSEGDYKGAMSWRTAPTGGPSASEVKAARTAKMASKLSGLADRLAALSAGGIKIKVGKSGLSGELSNRIGAMGAAGAGGNGSNLGGRLKGLASGSVGNAMKWNLVGTAGSSVSSSDQQRLADLMRSLQDDFRDCYEKALLVDESMAVTLRFESMITPTGKFGAPAYDMSGRSTEESERKLTGCMTGLLTKVQAGKSLAGITVKNQIIFK